MSRSVTLSRNDKIFLALSFFYIIYIIFPLFADWTHMPVYVPVFVVVVGVYITNPDTFKFNAIKWLFVYILLILLYTLIGLPIHINGIDASLPALWRITIEAAWILPSLMIASVLYHRNDSRLFRLFGFGSIVLLIASFLYILPLVMSVTNILREDTQDLEGIRPIGFPDYTLMHSYTLMLIPLCMMIRFSKGIRKLIAVAITMLFFFMVIQTAVTTSLFVALVIFIFSFLYNDKDNRKNVFFICLLGILLWILYYQGFFLWAVDSLMPYFEGTAVSFKLQDMHDSMIQSRVVGGSLTGRMEYHEISQNNFWQNPIIGGGHAGGHSKILDILGSMGLIVFIPFTMILWKSLKAQISKISSKLFRSFVIFSYACAFIYLYEKGLFGAPGWLFMTVIVPCAIMAQRKDV